MQAAIAESRIDQSIATRIARTLQLLEDSLPVRRRVVHAGDTVCHAGAEFQCLYVVGAGVFKTVNLSNDGREQVVGLHFRGDWLGLDGIANGHYGCDAVAMDTGEVWALPYDTLLQASIRRPALLMALHHAMSRELSRDHDCLQSLCALPADARVAGFLRYWADAVSQRGLRTDQITLRMSRAEIGNYLGMSLETVSRALSRMARGDVIRFPQKCRRDIQIPRIEALTSYMQGSARAPDASAALH